MFLTTGEKLALLRRGQNMTQEQLAERLSVSRQSVSKWESDLAFPETEKLLRLAELFDCSVDELLKPDAVRPKSAEANPCPLTLRSYEYTSARRVRGVPLVHICFGRGRCAHGIIAIGVRARGILSMGLLSAGIVSLGLLSAGVLSFGVLSLGLLAFGSVSAGLFAFGAVALGLIAAFGGVAVGSFAVGGLAVGNYFAFGGISSAKIAVGLERASGSAASYCGDPPGYDPAVLYEQIRAVTPRVLGWMTALLRLFL